MSGHDPREDYDDRPAGPPTPEEQVASVAEALQVYAGFQILIGLWSSWKVGKALVGSEGGEIPSGHDLLVHIFYAAIAFVSGALILIGSYCVKRFRGYRWAVTGAVVTMLSLPLVFVAVLTVPLGVWTLNVLRRPAVRARFAATERGTTEGSPPVPEEPR